MHEDQRRLDGGTRRTGGDVRVGLVHLGVQPHPVLGLDDDGVGAQCAEVVALLAGAAAADELALRDRAGHGGGGHRADGGGAEGGQPAPARAHALPVRADEAGGVSGLSGLPTYLRCMRPPMRVTIS